MEDIQVEPQPDALALAPELTTSRGVARRFSVNALVSLLRVGVNSVVALLLPAFLTHRLPVETYGAWVLILQMGAYVSFLDFGVQTGIAKFVAEFDSSGDRQSATRFASAGLVMMLGAATLGLLLTLGVAWQVPHLFGEMAPALFGQVRLSILLIGSSLCFGLVCSVYSAVFIGLQRYVVPTGIAIANRILSAVAIAVAVHDHHSLISMSVGVAMVNVTTGLLQIAAWRRWARSITVSMRVVRREAFVRVLQYCVVLAVWSASSLCVSGLDLTVIGHYAFRDTSYYSLATLPTNLVILIVSSVMAPFMPAASALSTQRTAEKMGEILERSTRYTILLLLLIGLPLLVFGQVFLRAWVGAVYAMHGIRMLQILVLATMVRNLFLPYSLMVLAVGKQRFATAATVVEAVVNLGSSLYLVRVAGGVGVAAGTLIGAMASVAMHFAVSMRYTSSTLALSRMRLALSGMLRPLAAVLPTLLLLPAWIGPHPLRPSLVMLWAVATLALMLSVGLEKQSRTQLYDFLRRRVENLSGRIRAA
jgi:O-antigen/teichoic acid export membrane protein